MQSDNATVNVLCELVYLRILQRDLYGYVVSPASCIYMS